MIRNITLKVKKPYYKRLNKLAPEVNFVWNYINQLSFYMVRNHNRFMSFYDIAPYLTGATEELGISASSIQEIAKTYVFNRKTARRRKLRWRCKRSLGWIPVRIQANRYKDGYFYYSKDIRVKLFDSYGLENYDLRSGSFFQDARRDWYLTLAVDIPVETINPSITSEIGIDLGLSTFATTSTGEKIESQRYYKELEPRIQTAQRANKKKLYASLHKRARNRRKDFLNKVSAKLTKENKLIVEAGVLKQGLRLLDNIRSGAWTINYPPDDGKFPCGLLGDDE